jgi:BlaI family transcriptional regulator, penicillinase repressor
VRIFRGPAEKTGIKRPLGDLEKLVMEVVWTRGSVTSTEVHEQLSRERTIAPTTVITTMDRLAKKGILGRQSEGKGYRYAAAVTREALGRRIVRKALEELLAEYPDAVHSLFAEAVGDDEAVHLEELRRLLQEPGE